MSRRIQITEAENIALIMVSDRDKVLPLAFGCSRVWLLADKAPWAVEELERLRAPTRAPEREET